jgi:hypothetical protein
VAGSGGVISDVVEPGGRSVLSIQFTKDRMRHLKELALPLNPEFFETRKVFLTTVSFLSQEAQFSVVQDWKFFLDGRSLGQSRILTC